MNIPEPEPMSKPDQLEQVFIRGLIAINIIILLFAPGIALADPVSDSIVDMQYEINALKEHQDRLASEAISSRYMNMRFVSYVVVPDCLYPSAKVCIKTSDPDDHDHHCIIIQDDRCK